MRKIALIAAMGLMGMGSVMAQSPINSNFDVTVNLLARCQLTAPVNTTLAFGDYTAFGSSITSNTVTYTLSCTRGFGSPVVTFDDLGAAGTTAGAGVVGGLRYTIASTVGAVSPGGNATATPASIGTPDTYSVALQGSMVGGQAGTQGAAGLQQRTLVISY